MMTELVEEHIWKVVSMREREMRVFTKQSSGERTSRRDLMLILQ